MLRSVALVAIFGVAVLTAGLSRAAEYGTADEARAMLEKAVAAVKADKTKALDMFNKGEGGFKDRDLYVFCANAADGILTAHPTMKGKQLREILGKKGYPLGQEMMQKATEGTIREVTSSEIKCAASATTNEPVYRWVAADSLVMTCLRRSGPTEISPVNGRL
jgi:hypothetical protein